MSPIEWPKWWAECNGRSFMTGVPFVGPHVKIIKEARLVLKNRDADIVRQLWSDWATIYPETVGKREKIFEIADRYVKWPNYNFIPTDRTPIVLGWIPGIWIDSSDVVDDIATCFEKGKGFIAALYESASKDTLIEFVKCLEKTEK